MVGDYNTLRWPVDKSSRQKINKETSELINTIDQMDLIVIHRISTQQPQNTFFSADHDTCSKIDHILGHKEILNEYKKIKITPCILSDNMK
jgi:hypothetical protein